MEYYNPVHLYAGGGSLSRLGQIAAHYAAPGSKVLLVTRGMDFSESEVHQVITGALSDYHVREEEFSVSNPDVKDLAAMAVKLSGESFDLIIAVGGGSVMDVAKTLGAVLHTKLTTAEELRAFIKKGETGPIPLTPWIGIPTTSGTGSEATPWATIWDRDMECKMSFSHPENFAKAAVIDPLATLTCPLGLTVSSALDAAAHATESYWSRHTSEVTRAFSLLAIRLIRANLPSLAANPHDEALREIIGKASLYAGLAFSNTRTTVCHSVSYPITEKFGVPHGTAVALTLGDFMDYNKEAIPDYEALLAAYGAKSAADVKAWVQEMLQLGRFPTALHEYGIKESDLPYIVSHAFTKGRADNNPVPVTEEAVMDILKKLY